MANILVIDDEVPARRFVAMALEKQGHAVSEAADGAEALRVMAERSIALVITDLLMPETDGIETILELRRRYPATKIIAISGGGEYQSGAGFLRAAESLGADRTLTKSPITPADQAEAYFILVSRRLSKTTGQVITVDGGLHEAFLR